MYSLAAVIYGALSTKGKYGVTKWVETFAYPPPNSLHLIMTVLCLIVSNEDFAKIYHLKGEIIY